MEKITLDGIAGDFLKLVFADDDRLYLPIYRLGRVQKYISGDHDAPASTSSAHPLGKIQSQDSRGLA